jgi:hypothetical protein
MKCHVQVKISMDDHSGHMVITSNWGQVIRDAELLEREMIVFLFREHIDDGLCVNLFSVISTTYKGTNLLGYNWSQPSNTSLLSLLLIKEQTCWDIIDLSHQTQWIKRPKSLQCWAQLNNFSNPARIIRKPPKSGIAFLGNYFADLFGNPSHNLHPSFPRPSLLPQSRVPWRIAPPIPASPCLSPIQDESPWQPLWPSLSLESDPCRCDDSTVTCTIMKLTLPLAHVVMADMRMRFWGRSLDDSTSTATWAIMELLLPLLQRHDWCADEVWRAQSMMLVLHKHNSREALKGGPSTMLSQGLIGAGCIMSLSTTMIESGSLHAVPPWSMNLVIIDMLAACYLIFNFKT